MDGIDRLFDAPTHTEFFAMLRSWHEKRAFEPQKPWRRLTVALACAKEAHLYIRDMNKSPFNVGVRIEVSDFGQAEIEELNRRLGGPLPDSAAVEEFRALVGGHPFLAQRGLRELRRSGETMPQFIDRADADDGPFADHLRRVRTLLTSDAELSAGALAVLRGHTGPERVFFRLRSAGIVRGEFAGAARFRCDLYVRYLRRHLL